MQYSEKNNILDFSSKSDGIPKPMLEIITVFYLLAALAVAFTIVLWVIEGFNVFFFVIGLIITVFFVFLGTKILRAAIKKDYITIDGDCIDSYASGLGKKNWHIEFVDSSRKTYSIITSSKKKHRILAGDRLYVYCPSDADFIVKDGVYEIQQYYGYERHA